MPSRRAAPMTLRICSSCQAGGADSPRAQIRHLHGVEAGEPNLHQLGVRADERRLSDRVVGDADAQSGPAGAGGRGEREARDRRAGGDERRGSAALHPPPRFRSRRRPAVGRSDPLSGDVASSDSARRTHERRRGGRPGALRLDSEVDPVSSASAPSPGTRTACCDPWPCPCPCPRSPRSSGRRRAAWAAASAIWSSAVVDRLSIVSQAWW